MTAELDADSQCMLDAKHGDDAALETLVRRHRNRVVQAIYLITRDRNASEELAQEVFLRVHRNRKEYEAKAKFTTWLHTIACRLALNWLRDNRHRPVLSPLDPDTGEAKTFDYPDQHLRVDQWLVDQCRWTELHRAIGALPERQRRVVLLHKFQDIDCISIAGELGCSHQAVRSLLVRAYDSLRASLAA